MTNTGRKKRRKNAVVTMAFRLFFVLLSGAVLLACQSYAAGYSKAGVLRWYMVAAAFAAALCTAGVLGIPLRALGRGIGAALRLLSLIHISAKRRGGRRIPGIGRAAQPPAAAAGQ